MRFLRSHGCLAVDVVPVPGPAEELLGRFRRHLTMEGGLQLGTINNYERAARVFLEAVGSPSRLESLEAREVTRFVVQEAARRSTISATSVACGLRSFLRFAYVEGLTALRLDSAVPTVPNWRAGARALFLRAIAPPAPMNSVGVRWVVYLACDRAGLERVGAHRLRHTTAAHLLQQGASLEEVAQVLRHRSIDTTAIYAKIDLGTLSAVARPWPGSAT